MIEWIVGALVVGAKLLGSKDRRSTWTSAPTSLFNFDSWEKQKAEEKAQWRLLWEGDVDRTRWIPQSVAHRIVTEHPPPGSKSKFFILDPVKENIQELLAEFAQHNIEHLKTQKAKLKDFFNSVETSPLTDEQAEACICLDDAVQIVASAGSGKTSTMVAKTGYILHERLARPEQILLLAFNTKAAEELRQRLSDRLADVVDIEKVTVLTFHAYGRAVLSKNDGKAPALARWVGSALREEEKVLQIVDKLKATDPQFAIEWDIFRTIFGRAINSFDGMPQPRDDGRGSIRTANGEWVKSQEERIIADWLFFHGVRYDYERDYEIDTRTPEHHQYRPDFYYPDAELYHEHFALDAEGKAPPHFTGDYAASAQWKRQCHADNDTKLFETTSHGLRKGDDLNRIREMLVEHEIEPTFDPDRPTAGQAPISARELAKLIRGFQQHVKGNAVDIDEIELRLKAKRGLDPNQDRSLRFLSIYSRIAAQWERELIETQSIDFDDMLTRAAEIIENGGYTSPYLMIFADEFQDSSRARIRLLKALLDQTQMKGHLCVVGDDWQSINRFAGADLTVMTEFAGTFPFSSELMLATTFRCPQSLCDVSSKFVSANPRQIKKSVQSTNPKVGTSIVAYADNSSENSAKRLGKHLVELNGQVTSGNIKSIEDQRLSVLLLGRYRHEQPEDLKRWQQQFGDSLDIQFRTVHSAKGLEADYVMILNVIEDAYGFPSQMSDDPILRLAMPAGDDFPMAEERRVFYVALTRARRQARIYTKASAPSRFLVEMSREGMLDIRLPGRRGKLKNCPKCKSGTLTARSGPYGPFDGCSSCDFKQNLPAGQEIEDKERVRLRTPMIPRSTCPTCGEGKMMERPGPYDPFVACSRYPDCKTTAPLAEASG